MIDAPESCILFGTCNTIRDAEDFITIKESIDGWKCLVRPFPFEFMTVAVPQQGTSALAYVKVATSWGLVLHKF